LQAPCQPARADAAVAVTQGLDAAALAALGAPDAYPGDASAARGVTWLQTHISHVFLTGDRVYKFRKDVDLGFLCFATRAERNADCLREVALNRRLAPDVYLGVAPLLETGGRVAIGPVDQALAPGAADAAPEHCVVMRRLPEGRDGLSLLERGALEPADLDRAAERVADFHRANGLGAPAPFSPGEWQQRCAEPVEECLAALREAREVVSPATAAAASRAAAAATARMAPRFEARRRAGRAVDGHGDLHLQHFWFERPGAPPVVVDCVEFSESLRRIDPASDVAFAAMDLDYRGRRDLGERFLHVYAEASDDWDLYTVVDYFTGYRAAVRAKVAAIAARDRLLDAAQRERAAASARRHLELAARDFAPRGAGALVLVGGLVGAGKSSAARSLADALPGVPIASDGVRKRRAGLDPTRPAPAGFYTPEARRAVYGALLERAEAVVGSGRVAILDAQWSRREDRDRAAELARRLGAPRVFVEVRCDEAIALERLAKRQAQGGSASDAGPSLLAASRAGFEPFDESAEGRRCLVDTGRSDWRDRLAAIRVAVARERG
jgi:aminoglycoside phosphotransferase family enzyme/predicted kinase